MKHVIARKINEAIKQLQSQHIWSEIQMLQVEVDYSQHREHGDYASSIAMKLAKVLKRNPLDICEELKNHINMEGLSKIEVVAPGFINFFINEEFLDGGIRYLLEENDNYGKNKTGLKEDGSQKKYMVEFLSANPTGPLHLGNGRGGFAGDVIVRVLRASGYDVTAEYIINDYGSQTDTLAESVLRRYLQKQGIKIDYPEDLYQGEYIKELADELELKDVPIGSTDAMAQMRTEVKEWALKEMIDRIKNLVENQLDIKYDVWKSEKSLYTDDNLARVTSFLEERNLIYTSEGAQFFRSSKYGDDKDRVIIRANGEPTYFYSDILYLIEKFEDRKFDHWIWLLGADHHGYKPRMEAALEALNHKGKMDIIFVQLVRLIFNGKELKMSKRKGAFVTLEELVGEVGLDVVRWFFLMHEPNTHMDFDLNLAREQSEKNPVYSVQYAHARICSILKKVDGSKNTQIKFTNIAEEELAKILFKLPEIVEDVSQDYQVHKLPQYAMEVARAFHKFYNTSRVIDEEEVNYSRLQLAQATKIVLFNTLSLMGISAPESM
ncbi:MAG: arginine--tRNA ligase [bacterium]|nr:arginine--tRNA ligase [bacterium]